MPKHLTTWIVAVTHFDAQHRHLTTWIAATTYSDARHRHLTTLIVALAACPLDVLGEEKPLVAEHHGTHHVPLF
jgi:hypothetical protein